MQQRSETTRAKILKAAQELFARGGYDATGVAEICAAAGVSKGAFYHHFASKQAVFLALLEAWLAELEPRLQAFSASNEDSAKALTEMSDLFKDIFASGAGQLPMFLEFWVQSSRDPEIWKATIAPYQRYVDFFAAMLQRGMDTGRLRVSDGRSAAQMVLAMAIGMILQGLFDPRGADWDRVAREGVETLMNGMARRKA